jgi:hypothetical protein
MILAKLRESHYQRKAIRERTTLSDHIRRTKAASILIPGMMVDGPGIFVCPRCQDEQPEPEHGDLFTCKACGTLYEVYGNSLGIG